jgi:hypothetical protein
MKYIYILYSDNLQQGYIGSTSLNLKRRLCFHKNDNRRNYGLSCCNILNEQDCKINKIFSFDDISKTNLEKLESQIIKQYKNCIYTFNNKQYKIVNKLIPYSSERFKCECGCGKELTKTTIRKHIKNININKK